MINARKLIKMARKWQRMAALSRKRISSFPGNISVRDAITTTTTGCTSSPSLPAAAEKGHFVVYTADQSRYSFPIAYLNNPIFRELFKMAEEEFGLPRDGPITIPCEAVFMDYVVSLIRQRDCRCSFAYAVQNQQETSHSTLLPCF